jgi:PAS domain S-box-containing protein
MRNKDIDMIVEYDKYVIASKTDARGIITYVSNAFADISGFEVEEMIGKSHNIVRHPDMPDDLYQSIWETITSGKIWQGEIKNKKKDGGYYWVFANIAPIFENGDIIGYSSVRKDITGEKTLMGVNKSLEYMVEQKVKEIRQKDKMLIQQSKNAAMGEMIDAIAHQWKNPLGVINMLAQKVQWDIKKERITNEKLDEYMKSTLAQVSHLTETIDEFRKFFRPNTTIETIMLRSMIDSTLLLLSDELKTHKIKTAILCDSDIAVSINQNEFKHVLINLVQNSRDAFEENNIKDRLISFCIKVKDDDVTLRIEDNAGGMDESIIDKIFKPHFTTKEEGKGTGIGLYLTKQIIEKNNASIDVQSEEDKSTFIIGFTKES